MQVTAHAVCCLLVSPAGSSCSARLVAAFTVQLKGGSQLPNPAAYYKCPACQLGTCFILSQSALDLGQHVSTAACVGDNGNMQILAVSATGQGSMYIVYIVYIVYRSDCAVCLVLRMLCVMCAFLIWVQ